MMLITCLMYYIKFNRTVGTLAGGGGRGCHVEIWDYM